MRYMSRISISQWMVYEHFSTLGCESPEPLDIFKVDDDRGAGGGTPSDSKLSISFIAFCISESCSRRSVTSLSYGIMLGRGTYSCHSQAEMGIAVSGCSSGSL